MRVTSVELNMAEDVFKLAHLLAANLLAQREEVHARPPQHTCAALRKQCTQHLMLCTLLC